MATSYPSMGFHFPFKVYATADAPEDASLGTEVPE
jgi:hypothetical protein